MLFSIGMTLIVFTIIIMLIPQKKEEKEENQKILIYDSVKEQKKHIEKMIVITNLHTDLLGLPITILCCPKCSTT